MRVAENGKENCVVEPLAMDKWQSDLQHTIARKTREQLKKIADSRNNAGSFSEKVRVQLKNLEAQYHSPALERHATMPR